MSLSSLTRAVVTGVGLALAFSALSFVPASADEVPSRIANEVNWLSERCGGDPKVPNDVNVVIRDVSANSSPESGRVGAYVYIAEVDVDKALYSSGRGLCIVGAMLSLKDTPPTKYTYPGGRLTLTAEPTGDPSRSVTLTDPIKQDVNGIAYAWTTVLAAPTEAITARVSVSGTESATTPAVTKTVSKRKTTKQKRYAKGKYKKSVAWAKKAYKKADHGSKMKKAKAKRAYKARLKKAKSKYAKAIRPTRRRIVVTPASTSSKPFTIVGTATVPGSA